MAIEMARSPFMIGFSAFLDGLFRPLGRNPPFPLAAGQAEESSYFRILGLGCNLCYLVSYNPGFQSH